MSERRPLSRRGFIGVVGGAAAGAGAIAVTGAGDGSQRAGAAEQRVPFHGERQSGIVTPAQDRLHFAAFDVTATSRAQLQDLLRAWSFAAERMTTGATAAPRAASDLAPPTDTGEADGLHAAHLTVTFGYGPGLFDGRFGLADRRPAALGALPALPGDELDAARCGGELCVQACADDPQVAFHAVRNLARIARGNAVMRWSQLGFGRTASTSRAQETPRNLMGFKDGTNNLTVEDGALLRRHVWAGDEAPPWLRGGSYLVARPIRMLIEVWDRATLADQQATIGRIKDTGAPLSARRERDPVPLRARGDDGELVIPADAHVRLAAPSSNGDARLLRRGYSFTDGFDAELGQLDAGLFFISFQRDPQAFIDVQNHLGTKDALTEYIKHVGSAVFAVPPGASRGGWVGERLFA